MTRLRISILGGGSVGLALAASYACAGADVTVLARGPAVQQLRQAGITVSGVAGDHHVPPHQLKVSDVDLPNAEDLRCDILVVATKAYQVQEALGRLMQSTGAAFAPGAVLLLQNGWGSAFEVRDMLPPTTPIFSSIMLIGMERRTPSYIHINVQAGPIRVGTLFSSADAAMRLAVERAQAGFLPMVYEDPIEPAILGKFLFSVCLNALGALTHMTYGELLTHAHTRQLITQIAEDTMQVLYLERDVRLAANGVDYVENYLLPLVIPKGAAHRSSMLQDVEAGRRTEIDYLNGAVLRMGRALGIATPYNDVISALVQARQSGAKPA